MNRLCLFATLLTLSTGFSAVVAADPKADKSPAPATAPAVEVQADGSLLLKAEGARIHGYRMHLVMKPIPTIIYWIDPLESIEWPQAIAKKGKYSVDVTYSCPASAGGDFIVAAAANKITARPEHTADWFTFITTNVGTITVLNDQTTLSLRSTGKITRALINVRSVKLTPVAEGKK
ncbi:MAG TPA: hypothetical protein VG326_07535 [Tepidisphaeraceae bacterium]|nr:hypothetical protein [Tepidisphaeraceae bacterium]